MTTWTAAQSDRIVAVTGAGTGIGRATARAFAAEGAHVAAIGRRIEPLEQTAAGHGRITPLAADITDEGEPERIIQAVSEAHGGLDVLVNNAGIVRSGALGTLSPQLIAAQLATNLVAPILLAQAALPPLEASGGVIVNVSTDRATGVARQLAARGGQDRPGAADPGLGGRVGTPRDPGGGARPRGDRHSPGRAPGTHARAHLRGTAMATGAHPARPDRTARGGGLVRNIRYLLAAGLTLDDVRVFLPCLEGDMAATPPSIRLLMAEVEEPAAEEPAADRPGVE
jgi:NAD(P)-dependent dehydrogenase (short-subunit alcohol dehydrogenase family)